MKKKIKVIAIFTILFSIVCFTVGCSSKKDKVTGPSEPLEQFEKTQPITEEPQDNERVITENNGKSKDAVPFEENIGAVSATDYIQYPINPWLPLNGYGFGRVVYGRYHLGDDCVRGAGTAVYSIYSGFVRYARYHGGDWGYIMIVESMINNFAFAVVYGHLGATMFPGEGRWVSKGQYIGTVGSTTESGQSTPHLHLGIKNLPASWPTGQYPYWCKGYTTSYSEMQTWWNPTSFIAYW